MHQRMCWKYHTQPAQQDEVGQYIPDPILVADPQRPDEPMLPTKMALSDELQDLRAVDLVEPLTKGCSLSED